MSDRLITIVVNRHPDNSDQIYVFVDGVQLTDSDYTAHYIDPGAGYTRFDWEENKREDLEQATSPAVRDLLEQIYDGHEGSQYIDDED